MTPCEKFNYQLTQLWNETFPKDGTCLSPSFQPPTKCGIVLFIGLNPSFDRKALERFRRDTNIDWTSPERHFGWYGGEEEESQRCFDAHDYAKKHGLYYKPHRFVFGDNSDEWEQIDLYRFRHSDAKKAKQLVKNKAGFEERSLNLFYELIVALSPKALIVLDATASRKLREHFVCEHEPEKERYNLTIGKSIIPTLFGGQQGKFDNYSMQRLAWHARTVLPISFS